MPEAITSVLDISIHAPTRGATQWGLTSLLRTGDFNPRSHKGSDSSLMVDPDGYL